MRAVLCFGNLKEAALYFDRALPMGFTMMRGTGDDIVFHCPDEIPSRALFDLLFGEYGCSESRKWDLFTRVWNPWERFIKATGAFESEAAREAGKDFIVQNGPYMHYKLSERGKFQVEVLGTAYLNNVTHPQYGSIREHVAEFATALSLNCADALLTSTPQNSLTGATVSDSEPILTIAGLPLVDVMTISWDQIIEIRHDAEAHQKLQRLRSFLVANYSGKSIAFIEDDLGRRIADYELTSQKHGLAVTTGAMSVLLDSKNIHAAVSAGIGAALFGGPVAGLGMAAVVELGKVVFEISKKRREFRDWKASHELAYIVDTRNVKKSE